MVDLWSMVGCLAGGVRLSLALRDSQLSNSLPRVREQTGSAGGPAQGEWGGGEGSVGHVL